MFTVVLVILLSISIFLLAHKQINHGSNDSFLSGYEPARDPKDNYFDSINFTSARNIKFSESPIFGSQTVEHLRDNRSQDLLGASFYLPSTDIFDPGSSGFKIFKPFTESCYTEIPMRETKEIEHQFSKTYKFYTSLSLDTGISALLNGPFTMGATLNLKSDGISSGFVEVNGMFVEIATHVKSSYLNKNCYETPTIEFTDDFMNSFDLLPVQINEPWLSQSWEQYETFLNEYGSHFLVEVLFGASVRQWTFAKLSSLYELHEILVKACFDLGGSILELNLCLGISEEEYEKYKDIEASNSLNIRGGKDETRNAFRNNRTRELLDQILNEGRNMSSPVGYKYKPVWDVLMIKFQGDPKRKAVAMNLKQYYYGFKDFGCEPQMNGNTKLRSFEYSTQSNSTPIFQCLLINQGCHSDGDCHIGGAGTVTYCYGASCYEYISPSFGKKATDVTCRGSKEGSYDEGINNSCRYKSPFRARCDFDYYGSVKIWDGGNIF